MQGKREVTRVWAFPVDAPHKVVDDISLLRDLLFEQQIPRTRVMALSVGSNRKKIPHRRARVWDDASIWEFRTETQFKSRISYISLEVTESPLMANTSRLRNSSPTE